ncbi:Transcription factor IIIC, subunit 5, putative isoform 2 [Hibiscus syriacus]|uniref:Transcription factor IIIC, subunit 5, putative isoform 2 n=1 Tax=Hibiscus syriacus TaxID=106335 RepID=A0A6A2XMN2_HIBSY|nr:Transcription factor IIIC, subunit 5, putative isoform 2 [Hibiscus syriacus]
MTVSKLFDERPIWPKESITERLLEKGLKFSHLVLKRLLLGVAYYFSNGPFLRFWIRKGYDPRKDPDSRIYQRTEFRAPEPLRSYADASAANNLKHKWGDLCSFQPKTGWFSECMLDCLRLRVAVRFLSIYPEAGAESILKSYSDEFEKLKRSCMYKDVFNSHQEEHRQTNKGDENIERPKNSDNEEDEVEADDEEELDMYNTLNLGDEDDEDDEISLQPDTYLDMENNSRTYLQELFGSFPSAISGAADAIQAADGSDGEYQIYEQFSDNNYSDDDEDDGDDDSDGGDDS